MNVRTIPSASEAVIIRPTTESDAAAYRTLRLEALQLHPQAFSAEYETTAERSLDYWRDLMWRGAGSPAGITYVAQVEDQLIGMVVLVRNESPKLRHSANMYSVYVQPAWRTTGVAERLVSAALQWAREQGVRVVKLAVIATNAGAIRLYLRCGFSVYGVEPEAIAWSGHYCDELLMVCRLNTLA